MSQPKNDLSAIASETEMPDVSVSRSEWWLVTGASCCVAMVAFLPYLFGYLTTPEGSRYLGFVLNARDQNTYFMWMIQVASGDFFLRNLYTAIPHDGAMLNLYFVLAGLPARWFGWSLDTCYQLARVLSSVALGLSCYAFAALFFPRGHRRWVAWFAVMFTAGLGWFTSLLRLVSGEYGGALSAEEMLLKPVDTWIPEAFPGFSITIMPHFSMALACLFLTLRWTALGMLRDRMRTSLLAGCSLFLLSFVHPYDVLVLYAIVFGAALVLSYSATGFSWRPWRHVSLIYAIATPPILYNYLILNQNAGMRAWLEQNRSASPGPYAYVVGFGIPLLLAIVWSVQFWRERRQWCRPQLFLAIWIFLTPFLLYAPVSFQRRLVIGLSAPLAAAMVLWLYAWVERRAWRPWLRESVVMGVVLAASLTTLFHGLNGYRKVADRGGENYLSLVEVEALEAIRQETVVSPSEHGTVLSSFRTGNAVPRFTGLAAVIGSRGQTGDFDRVLEEMRAFYAGDMDAPTRRDFLGRHRVEYVYRGPTERAFDPDGDLVATLLDDEWAVWRTSPDGGILILRNELNNGALETD